MAPALMGPTVWDDEGPMPIENRSNMEMTACSVGLPPAPPSASSPAPCSGGGGGPPPAGPPPAGRDFVSKCACENDCGSSAGACEWESARAKDARRGSSAMALCGRTKRRIHVAPTRMLSSWLQIRRGKTNEANPDLGLF